MKKIKKIYNKYNYIIIVVSLILIVVFLLGETYAMFQKIDEAEYTNVYKTGNLQIELDDTSEGLGEAINLNNAVPISDLEGEATTPYKFKIKNTGTVNYQFDLKLVLDSTYVSSHGCSDKQLNTQYIKIKINDQEITLLSELTDNILLENITIAPQESLTYELRAWLKEGTPNSEIGKHYHGKLAIDGFAIYTDPETQIVYNEPNAPELVEGLIPVTYNDSTNNWVVANSNNSNNSWYDYENQKWANAVMVSTDATSDLEESKSRSEYMSASAGTEVLESDILAYFVWIPRYKYKLFNADYESGTSSQLIDIAFERGKNSTGTVTCTYADDGTESCTNKENGNWYTHPAFTFGDKELKGIWVSKFETTGSSSSPTVKPNTSSLRSIKISVMYSTSQLFMSTNYLTKEGANNIDSHMMKNMEWGAVAYLKQSAYGLGTTDITINSDSSYHTGGNDYKTNVAQSITGNITGIYDMSGGAWEYVMGNYAKTTGNFDFNVSNVASKYIDFYAGTSVSYSHLGDATGETASWYGNYVDFVVSSYPWFFRGGGYDNGASAGVFYFGCGSGGGYTGYGFRVVLTTN